MAQQVNVSFVDDLDGGEADGTVVFGMDGKQYEIDLSEKNAAKLRDLLAPYVGAGRRLGVGSRPPRTTSVPRTNREDSKVIREWAAAQGLTASARGRISSEVLQAYQARGQQPVIPEAVADAPAPGKTRSRAKVKRPEFSSAR